MRNPMIYVAFGVHKNQAGEFTLAKNPFRKEGVIYIRMIKP